MHKTNVNAKTQKIDAEKLRKLQKTMVNITKEDSKHP